MKNIILITFLFFVYSCGYTSVYKNLGEQDFQIVVIKMKGDRDMNNLIKNQINLYSNKNSINIFDVEIESDFQKLILSKNESGLMTVYELSVKSTFTINFNEKTQKRTFNETINITERADTFEQDEYERSIKRNFASSIREKLISEIITKNYGDGVINTK